MLQALRGRGAVLRGVAQRCQEEAGQGGGLLPSPAVPVHQHGLQAARGEPGDPQESAWGGHEERGDVRSTEIHGARRSDEHRALIALRQRSRLQLFASRTSAEAALPSVLTCLPKPHPQANLARRCFSDIICPS